MATRPQAAQHLGRRAPYRLLEVHGAAPAAARSRDLVPTRRRGLAGAPGSPERSGLAARPGATRRAAPLAAARDCGARSARAGPPRMALEVVRAVARVRHRVARSLPCGPNPAAPTPHEEIAMFIGHYALGLASKRVAPRPSLVHLFIAPTLADLLWPVFLLLGVEHAHIVPGPNPFLTLWLDDFPYSHSLFALIVWGALFGSLYKARTG